MGVVRNSPTFLTDICLCGKEFFGSDGRTDFLKHSVDCKVQKVFRGEMTQSFSDSTKQFEKMYNNANEAVKQRDEIIAKLNKELESKKN